MYTFLRNGAIIKVNRDKVSNHLNDVIYMNGLYPTVEDILIKIKELKQANTKFSVPNKYLL